MIRAQIVLVLALLVASSTAFCNPGTIKALQPIATTKKVTASSIPTKASPTTTALAGRRWNFNEGQTPWGLKKNAEIWNGRVGQMAFVVVFLQELIQGKGVIQGISEGDPINLAVLGVFAVSVVGLTGFLALQGDDDYVARDM